MATTTANYRNDLGDDRVAYDVDTVSLHLPVDVLAAAARGELDLNALARAELANMGRDEQGEWVGFGEAAEALGVQVYDEDGLGDERDWRVVRDVRN